MHPLLTRNRLGLYLLGWIPLAATLVLLMTSGGNLSWLESSVIAIPLCAVYAFICLSAWYTAKSSPIKRESALRLIGVHSLAAALVSYFWMGLGWVLVASLSKTAAFQGLDRRFARQAELKALKAQINPHFLFNSLNSISALTSIDPARARDMCVLLGDFLRLTLGLGEKASVHLSEELDLLQKYMAIEKVRFGARLRVHEEIQEDSKTCSLPPLLLQPLVENAVKHGIASLPEGGDVRLAVQRQTGRLAILVENSWDPEAPPRRSGGLGLKNVQRRLEARYGKEARLSVNTEGELFQVSLSLPAESEEKE